MLQKHVRLILKPTLSVQFLKTKFDEVGCNNASPQQSVGAVERVGRTLPLGLELGPRGEKANRNERASQYVQAAVTLAKTKRKLEIFYSFRFVGP
jgi:hypothetical protein